MPTAADHRKIAAMNDRNHLGALIRSQMDANGWTLRDLQDRSAGTETPTAHSTFDRMLKTPVAALKASTVKMLAATLGVSEATVTQAALKTMGLLHEGPAEDLPAVVRQSPELTAHDKRLLLGMIDLMRSTESEQSNDRKHDEHPDLLHFPSRGDAVDDGAESRQEVSLEDVLKVPAKSRKGKRQRDLVEETFPDDEASQDPDDHA